jgi:8-oxo-dGTP pyrophosphatase MutT (NUDIX family)
MGHLHTAPGAHDACVSFFIVRTDLGEPRITYHVHRKTGMLSMFGGHIEENESPWQAALREITEETGYKHAQLRILQPQRRLTALTGAAVHPVPVVSYTGQYPAAVPHFHTDLMHALIADEPAAGAPATGESTDIRLYTRAELAEVPAETMTPIWREIGYYILSDVLGAWEPLPLSAFA